MATLTAQALAAAGLNPTYAAADVAGDEFAWSNGVFCHVKNDDAGSHTVTVVSQATARPGIAPANIEVAIPAGEARFIGPLNQSLFADADGNVQITYDAVTSVTIAVLK